MAIETYYSKLTTALTKFGAKIRSLAPTQSMAVLNQIYKETFNTHPDRATVIASNQGHAHRSKTSLSGEGWAFCRGKVFGFDGGTLWVFKQTPSVVRELKIFLLNLNSAPAGTSTNVDASEGITLEVTEGLKLYGKKNESRLRCFVKYTAQQSPFELTFTMTKEGVADIVKTVILGTSGDEEPTEVSEGQFTLPMHTGPQSLKMTSLNTGYDSGKNTELRIYSLYGFEEDGFSTTREGFDPR